MAQSTFYDGLREELIKNKYDVISVRSGRAPESVHGSEAKLVAGAGTFLVVKNRKKIEQRSCIQFSITGMMTCM